MSWDNSASADQWDGAINTAGTSSSGYDVQSGGGDTGDTFGGDAENGFGGSGRAEESVGDGGAPRGACYNCGKDGLVYFSLFTYIENSEGKLTSVLVTTRLIAPSLEFSDADTASRKVT